MDGGSTVAVNLGTGVAVSVMEIVKEVERVTGLKVPVQYAARRPGDPPVLLADPSLAEELLGWKAANSDLAKILQSAYSWFSRPHGGKYE